MACLAGLHHGDASRVWLVLAKKGTTQPTSVTYDQALDEALCFGWIDGSVRRRDEATYLQRFTPRRARSPRARRIEQYVAMLARGETSYPQQRGTGG